MSHHRLEDLEVYRLAESFSDEVWEAVMVWDYFAKDTVVKQIARSADSISANIAKGYGRFHYKENKNFCYFSRGSIIGTKGWLNKSRNRKLMSEEKATDLLNKLEIIHIKLNAYIKFIGGSSKA